MDRFEDQANDVLLTQKAREPVNTTKAYEGKEQEFIDYCDDVYCDEPNPRLITAAKCFGFMFYTANRERRRSKKNSVAVFDRQEYDKVMSMKQGNKNKVGNVCGIQTIQH